jgi:hypothetical protein
LGSANRIDVVLIPPFSFVPASMQGAMMNAAERDRELVAHASAKGGWLREPDMVCIRRTSLTDKAGL